MAQYTKIVPTYKNLEQVVKDGAAPEGVLVLKHSWVHISAEAYWPAERDWYLSPLVVEPPVEEKTLAGC